MRCCPNVRGFSRRAHNEKCNKMLREVLQEGAKVRNAEERKQELEQNEIEKKIKMEQRKEDSSD